MSNREFTPTPGLKWPKVYPPTIKNLVNTRFARLLVIGYAGYNRHGHFWLCRCDCGTFKTYALFQLDRLKDPVKSCGCWNRERAAQPRTHGMSRTLVHRIWCAMKTRGHNPNIPNADDYSLRGITVDPAWESFEVFYADMGDPPSPKYSIERRDNNAGYSKDNCYWATRAQQSRNKRNNIWFTRDGQTLILKDWCALRNLNYATVRFRIKRSGYTIEQALDFKEHPIRLGGWPKGKPRKVKEKS